MTTRVFTTRDGALAFMRARGLDERTHAVRLVPGLGYVLTSLGYDPGHVRRAA